MIIHPVPVILPASPLHQFMAGSNIGKFGKERAGTRFENICLFCTEMESFNRRHLILARGTPREGCKASDQENKMQVLRQVNRT